MENKIQSIKDAKTKEELTALVEQYSNEWKLAVGEKHTKESAAVIYESVVIGAHAMEKRIEFGSDATPEVIASALQLLNKTKIAQAILESKTRAEAKEALKNRKGDLHMLNWLRWAGYFKAMSGVSEILNSWDNSDTTAQE